MRRDDLPPGYDGWQVLDATSQEKQCGRYRIGPTSVRAVRERVGGKQWLHDTEYIISEVSADVRYLRVSKSLAAVSNRAVSVAKVCHGEVGTLIVTSAGTGSTPLNITTSYRDKELSPSSPVHPSSHFPPPTRDCTFELVTSDKTRLGDEIVLSVRIMNEGLMMRTVDGRVVGKVVYHTGTPVRSFMSMQFSGVISPGQSEPQSECVHVLNHLHVLCQHLGVMHGLMLCCNLFTPYQECIIHSCPYAFPGASVTLPIESRKYLKVLVEQSLLQFFVVVKVRESKQLFLKVS